MKRTPFYRVLSTHFYFLKLAWSICPRRVCWEMADALLNHPMYLFLDVVVIRLLIPMATEGAAFPRILGFLWCTVLIFLLIHLESNYVKHIVRPSTDPLISSGINSLLQEKACQVDLGCFEDSDFYNQYMMALTQSQARLSGTLQNVANLVGSFMTAALAFVLILQIDRPSILFLIFPLLGNFLFNGILNNRIFAMDREMVIFRRIIDYADRTIRLSDYARELRLTNVFALMKKKYEDAVSSLQAIAQRYSAKNMVFFWLFQYFTFTLLYEGALIYAGYRTLASGTMTFAELIVFQNLFRSCTWQTLFFSEAILTAVKDSLYVEQIRDFLGCQPDIPEDGDGISPEPVIRSIRFEHVSFSYKNGRKVLRDVSFEAARGQTLALVGFNGAGKTTLIKLLLRFYDPQEGQIFVNDVDIRRYNLRQYRELFAAAFQDGKIFADTLLENVLMGHHTEEAADRKRVREALRLSGLSPDPSSGETAGSPGPHFPDPDTILTREFDSQGFVPSGGQAQKLVAARAFARDCSAAIFDEPSSALDPMAEAALFRSIMEAEGEKILIFISHRLSSVQNADQVFFMENGKITERGTHTELMEQDGKYARLYRVQAKNYRTERSCP